MYAIYKREPCEGQPILVSVCFTKHGSKKACKHFHDIFQRETGRTEVDVFCEELMYYPTVKLGYALLTRQRRKAHERLKRLEYKETVAANNKFAQQIRLSELYY